MTNLRKVGFLVPEEDLVKYAELETLSGLVLKEDFECFVALTLGFPQVNVPKFLLDPEVFPRMFLDSDESRVLVGPKIFFKLTQ